ncbi:hypothetical protein RHECNPAF_930093 [Rhizobium etli CNPAF512]|nr:hypothetical protein RHECNPAF_930093 [Rhizobium etli CNPAF512]
MTGNRLAVADRSIRLPNSGQGSRFAGQPDTMGSRAAPGLRKDSTSSERRSLMSS